MFGNRILGKGAEDEGLCVRGNGYTCKGFRCVFLRVFRYFQCLLWKNEAAARGDCSHLDAKSGCVKWAPSGYGMNV